MTTIRKIKSPYSYITKTIVIAIIIMLLIGQVIHRSNKQVTISDQDTLIFAPNGINEWEFIQASGYIQQDNNFPIYTHTLILQNQAKIWLRSTSTNLNNITILYEVRGIIQHIEKWIPSIDIQRLKSHEHKQIIQNNIYTYLQQKIIIDLSTLNSIHSTISENNIEIIADNAPIITITHLDCDQETQLCENYKDQIQNSETERFVSITDHTFYKTQENNWILISENNGIYVFSWADEDIIDYSWTIEIIDPAYIVKLYQSEIFTSCNELENIQTASLEQKENTTMLTAQWTNTKSESIGCRVSIDLWNDRWITNVSLF